MALIAEMKIAENYQHVLEQIAAAATAAGRDPKEVKLVVVTKGHSVADIQAVTTAGASWLGENYTEEAIPKIKACASQTGLTWHMIGHVQSRKAEAVCAWFQWVHSLDSLKLARRLDQFAGQLNRTLPVLLECNVSGEAAKSGWPAWREDQMNGLALEIHEISAMTHLHIQGLMTMPPLSVDPDESRIYFKRLHSIQSYLAGEFPRIEWKELSMGMSADFPVAIQEGATIVRIGTAIMGPRPI